MKATLSTKEVTGIILAGGKNSRMGRNKAFLSVDGKEKFIESTVALFNKMFAETIIVTKNIEQYEFLDADVIADIIPKPTPLSGIHAGLIKAKTEYSFVVACDMPFLDENLIEFLVKEAPGFDVVVPQIGTYLEPLHAVYGKNCIKTVEEFLHKDIKKTYAFYPFVNVNFVGESKMKLEGDLEKIFFNVNTEGELEKARVYKRGNNNE